MGFWGNVGGRVRGLLKWDKEQVVLNLAKGGTASGYPQTGFDLLQAYGHDVLSDYLKLEHDLMARFVDYEEMDDYPELACLHGDSRVFTLEYGWEKIVDLAVRGGDFHVLAYDRETKSLVPAPARNARRTGASGHTKKMVRVLFDNGQEIVCTSDHLFFTKEEEWVEAGALAAGRRLMPGVLRTRALNGSASEPYWEVHQPNADSNVRSSDGKRWTWVHRVVGERFLGAGKGDIVHHKDENQLNNAPSNLNVEDCGSHASHHIAGIDNSRYLPEWTDQRRREKSKAMLGNSYRAGSKDSAETKQRKSDARKGKPLSATHRQRIGDAHRIELSREQVEAAYAQGGTVTEAAKILDVSWSTARRNLDRYDLIENDNNHRVVSVEVLSERPEVFDLEVPGYHNFICNGVVVHNSAIDIYADDATQTESLQNRAVWVDSSDKTVQTILEDLLWRRLRMDEEIWEIARTLVKYGNNYEELLVTQDGVVGLNFLPPPTMRRIEGRRGELFGFVQDYKGRFGYSPDEFKQLLTQRMAGGGSNPKDKYAALEDWEVAHFRLRSRHRRSIYGYSVLEPARWIWKRLMLLEDAAMVYRLQRAPQRYAFYIDVGDMPPKEAMAFLHKIRQQYKKTKFYNPQTGKLDLKFNPLSQDEDFFVPVRKGVQQTKIDVVGSPSWQHMEDIEYFRLKLYAAIKVPKVYLGSEAPRAKGVLSQEDVRFARTVLRLQRELRNGMKKMCRVHLAALNINPAAVDWDIHMTTPSSIFELAQLEVRNAKADFAGRMSQFVSLHWILQKVFGLSEGEIEYIIKERHQEQLSDAEIQAKAMGLQMDVQNQAQVQQQAASAEIQTQQAAAQQQMAPPAGAAAEDLRKHLRPGSTLSHRWPQMRQQLGYRPITEQELFQGNREHEKLVEDNLDKILGANNGLSRRLSELGQLMNELKANMPNR